MPLLFAQPYDITAEGFYFDSADYYRFEAKRARKCDGAPVEEFEIQFIEGDSIDAEFAKAFGLNQGNLEAFFDAVDDYDEAEKQRIIIAVCECGYDLQSVLDDPHAVDLDIYAVSSLKELAEQFVEEGLFGDIPEALRFYIDHDAIARDLAADYCETTIASEQLVYRCG